MTGRLYEGARVMTPKGAGVLHKIQPEVRRDGDKTIRRELAIVQLDNRPPSAVRSIFYTHLVELLDDDVEVEIEVHGDPED